MGLARYLAARVGGRSHGSDADGRLPRRPSAGGIAALCLVAAALLLSLVAFTQTQQRRVLFDRNSPYTRVLVVEEKGLRCLRFVKPDAGNQSCVDLEKPERIVFEYVRHASVGLTFVPEPRRAVIIGIGGGSIIHLYRRHVPTLHFDAVDLDPVVVEVAQRYFDLRPEPGLRLVAQDGRKFLETSSEQWDLIFLDAYGENNVPFALTTVEFLQAVSQRLAPHGAVVANIWRDNRPLYRSMLKTYGQVFSAVHVFPAPTHYNSIVVAMRCPKPLSRAEVLARARTVAAARQFSFDYLSAPKTYRRLADHDLSKSHVLVDAQPEVHGCLMKLYTDEEDCVP